MRDPVEFLRTCLDEDEAHARMAVADHNNAGPEWSEIWSGAVQIGEAEDLLIINDAGVSRHIARHDPARVLAEVDAKRRIIEMYEGAVKACNALGESTDPVAEALARSAEATALTVVELLASTFADTEETDR